LEHPLSDLETVSSFLTQRGLAFTVGEIEHGKCLRVGTGEVVNFYNTGRIVVQGKKTALHQELKGLADSGMQPAVAITHTSPAVKSTGPSKRVFIVYGHDKVSLNSLELMLLKMGMEPIVLGNLAAGGDTIIEKLEEHLKESHNVGFACVLLTPDDVGYRSGHETEAKGRARQNVILELGMFLARLGRKRVAILYKTDVERPSDIDGLLYLPFDEHVDEAKTNLFKELQAAGYTPDTGAL